MLQDNEVINNSFEGTRLLYPVFKAEKHAECRVRPHDIVESYVYEALQRFDLKYEKKCKINNCRLELDLVIKHDRFFYPIELKPDLSSKKLMGRAVAQASSYASIIEQPVFIGPINYTSKRIYEHDRVAAVAGNFNVGFMCFDQSNFKLTIAERHIMHIDEAFGITKNKMYFVTWQGSKKTPHEVKPK